jgi:hypothetical protein
MHQSRTFSSQSRYTFVQRSGAMRSRPERTASMAGPARGFMLTNHCSEMSGSITSFERSDTATLCSISSIRSSSPRASRSATILSRAASRVSPAYGPPASPSVPSGRKRLTMGSPKRCPRS